MKNQESDEIVDVEAPPETASKPPEASISNHDESLARGNESHDTNNNNDDNDKPLATIKEVFSFGKGPKKRTCLVLGALCAACAGAIFPALAFFFSQSFSTLGASTSNEDFLNQVRQLSFTFITLGALAFVFMAGDVAFIETAADVMTLDLKMSWFQALLRQDMTYYDIQDVSSCASIISTNGQLYKKGLGHKFAGCIQFSVTFVGGIAFAFWSSWQVSLLLLTTIPFIATSAWFLITMNQSQSARASAGYATAASIVQTTVAAIRTIFSLNAVEHVVEQFRAATLEAYQQAVKVLHWIGLANGVMFASFQLGYIVVLLFGSYLLYRNVQSSGCDPSGSVPDKTTCNPDAADILGALIGIMFAATTLPQISIGLEAFTNARAACYPAIQAMNRTVESNDDSSEEEPTEEKGEVVRRASCAHLPKYVIDSSSDVGVKLPNVDGAIQFHDVTFSYPTRREVKVLNGFSVNIQPGETVALVGPSGCGKSTVVALLERFYDPQEGSIKLDGHDLRELNVHWLRQQIGLVGQEPTLFDCSIRDNIAYGLPGATQEQIEEAARMANAHDFIIGFSNGYDTIVSSTALSGGEKQRISIARALIKNPKILLLDESTSALDSESEKQVQDALDNVVAGRKHTTLVVAHRLSTITGADRIFVVDHGKIIETGTHVELSKQQGLYHDLVEAQNANPAERRSSSVSDRRRSSLTSAIDIDELEGYEEEVATIEFRDVSFTYPSRPENIIFHGLSFRVYEGETLALVGPSGHGKSTTISLLERFYDPDSGGVYLDGVNLKEINIQWLRSQLGLVSQEPVLFDTTIAENIRMGLPGATQEQIEAAAQQAFAHDFIVSFPDGYNTRVGSGAGDQVSVGQRQRISIARALIGKPRVMLLDEATSALDSGSEKVVQDALDKIMKSRSQTTIVIAHRLSTITGADRIGVICNGKIREIGTHEELMAKPNGHYRRLQAFQDLQGSRESLGIQTMARRKRYDSSRTAKESKVEVEERIEENIDKETAKGNAHRARLLAGEDKRLFVIGGVGAIFAGLMFPAWGVLLAFVIETLYTPNDCPDSDLGCDNNIADDMRTSSFMVTIGCVAVMVTVIIGNVLLYYGFGTASERMNKRVRDATFESLVRQEVAWFDLRPVGAITSQLQDDAALIHSFSGEPIRTAIMTMASLLVGLIISFIFMWPFTLITLAIVPFMAFGAEVKMKVIRGEDEGVEDDMDSPGTIVVESLMNIRTVASLTIEQEKADEHKVALRKKYPSPLRTNFLAGMALGLADLIRLGGIALMFFVGGWLLVRYPTTFSFRDFLISMFSLLYSISGIGMAAQGATDREAAKRAAHRIFELIDRQSAIDSLSVEGKKNI